MLFSFRFSCALRPVPYELVTMHEFLSTGLTCERGLSGMDSHVGTQIPDVRVTIAAVGTIMCDSM